MKKRFDRIFIILCSAFIAICGIALLLPPFEEFSEEENRALAKPPHFSISSLVDGEYFKGISDFFCDQFPQRRSFTTLKAVSELSLGRLENNGVVFGDDGYLIVSPSYSDLSVYEKNLSAIDKFHIDRSKKGDRITVFFAPRGADILKDKLPVLYPTSDISFVWDIARQKLPYLISATDTLSSRENDVWFRTDHHWNTFGAYVCYTSLGRSLGYEPLPLDHWELKCVSKDFVGTVSAKSGAYTLLRDTLYIPISSGSYSVIYHDQGLTRTTLYDMEKLDRKDKYSVFLGGNFGHLSISTPNGKREKLIIIKDSFANSVIPYLAEHFDLEIYDLRYFKEKISDELSDKSNNILILYGIESAITEGSLKYLNR